MKTNLILSVPSQMVSSQIRRHARSSTFALASTLSHRTALHLSTSTTWRSSVPEKQSSWSAGLLIHVTIFYFLLHCQLIEELRCLQLFSEGIQNISFTWRVYSWRQNYSTTCDNTCDFSLVWLLTFIILCFL